MNLELVRLTSNHKEQIIKMLTEWKNDIIVNHTDMSPWKIWANDFHDFDYYIKNLDTKEENKNGWVILAMESDLVKEERVMRQQ